MSQEPRDRELFTAVIKRNDYKKSCLQQISVEK